MNELATVKNGQTLDSREVAKMVDKQHNHLMRDIEGYIAAFSENPNLGSHNYFIPSSYKADGNNKTYPCYLITRKGCEMVANKMTGAKGVQFTAAYIERFHEMERGATLSIPQSLPEALRLAADLAERNQTLMIESERKDQIIGELQPKADHVDFILSSPGTMATSQIAADYGLSANRLNKILHEEGIQHKVGDQWLLYKKHMGMGYTKSETIAITRSDGRPDTKLFTRWTQKGRLMINEILNKRGIYADLNAAIA